MSVVMNFIKNHLRSLFGIVVIAVVIYAFNLVLSSDSSMTASNISSRLRLMFPYGDSNF